MGCAAAVGFWGARQPRSNLLGKQAAESAAQAAWGTHRSMRDAAPDSVRSSQSLTNGLPILGKGPTVFQVLPLRCCRAASMLLQVSIMNTAGQWGLWDLSMKPGQL